MNSILNSLSHTIIGGALRVHRELGPGLLESAYEKCLVHELRLAGLTVDRQRPLSVCYRDLVIERAYIADIVVNDAIVVEVKTVEELTDVHRAQVLTQLKWTKLSLGLLLNFNVKLLRDGIRRVVRGLPD